jgi:hypothetical protein
MAVKYKPISEGAVRRHELIMPAVPKERPTIQPRDLPVHRFINSSNGLREIRRLKQGLSFVLPVKNRTDRRLLVSMMEQLNKIEQEFESIKQNNIVPPKFDLARRKVTLSAIYQILLRKKMVT